jgi:probable rRNA maturation factor
VTFTIEIQNDSDYPIQQTRLVNAAQTVLTSHPLTGDHAMTIVITENDDVQALNQQYRGVDAPTDVLSFPAGEPPIHIDGEPVYLGDLVIAFPYASAQAAREGHALDDSLALLVVHGTLHLLGYDHDRPASRAEMWSAQEQALRTLQIPLGIVPALEGGVDGTSEMG